MAVIHIPPAQFTVQSAGLDLTQKFNPYLIHISITNQLGALSHCEIVLDDTGGQIQIPPNGSDLTVGLGWSDTGPLAVFKAGTIINVHSHGSRAHGRTLTSTSDAADLTVQSKAKASQEVHTDNKSLQDAASIFGQSVDKRVTVIGPAASKMRDYWAMPNESFYNWIQRIAREYGLEVGIEGKNIALTPVGSNKSASGQTIGQIECDCGPDGNAIDWNIIPQYSRLQFDSHKLFNMTLRQLP
jgi:uncharacterized protein